MIVENLRCGREGYTGLESEIVPPRPIALRWWSGLEDNVGPSTIRLSVAIVLIMPFRLYAIPESRTQARHRGSGTNAGG